MKPVGRDYQTG